VAQALFVDQYLPTSLHLRGVTPRFKLYEYVPDDAGRPPVSRPQPTRPSE
jgi:hypothetical protein